MADMISIDRKAFAKLIKAGEELRSGCVAYTGGVDGACSPSIKFWDNTLQRIFNGIAKSYLEL